MKKMYIAGPMSGLTNFNRDSFHSAEYEILREGNAPLNPAYFPDGLTQCEYMQLCCPMVMMADELLMLSGWEISAGAKVEHELALKCGKVINYQEMKK